MQEQRNETESEHIHMAGFPGAWKMFVRCEKNYKGEDPTLNSVPDFPEFFLVAFPSHLFFKIFLKVCCHDVTSKNVNFEPLNFTK